MEFVYARGLRGIVADKEASTTWIVSLSSSVSQWWATRMGGGSSVADVLESTSSPLRLAEHHNQFVVTKTFSSRPQQPGTIVALELDEEIRSTERAPQARNEEPEASAANSEGSSEAEEPTQTTETAPEVSQNIEVSSTGAEDAVESIDAVSTTAALGAKVEVSGGLETNDVSEPTAAVEQEQVLGQDTESTADRIGNVMEPSSVSQEEEATRTGNASPEGEGPKHAESDSVPETVVLQSDSKPSSVSH